MAITTSLRQLEGIHLALGGGGARGLTHLGILKALQAHQIPIASICGTSMGSLVGACFALNPDADKTIQHFQVHVKSNQFHHARYSFLREVTRQRSVDRKVSLGQRFLQGYLLSRSYTKGSIIPFEEFQTEVKALLPSRTFSDTSLPFFAVAVDLTHATEVVFHRGLLRSAVMASSAIPGVFAPIMANNITYVDGGWMNKVPATPLLALGADKVLAINVSDVELPEFRTKRGTSINRAADIASQIRLQELQMTQADLIWSPSLKDFDLMEFHRVDDAVTIGFEYAEKHLDDIHRLLERKKTPRWKQVLAERLGLQSLYPILKPSFEFRGIFDITAGA